MRIGTRVTKDEQVLLKMEPAKLPQVRLLLMKLIFAISCIKKITKSKMAIACLMNSLLLFSLFANRDVKKKKQGISCKRWPRS